MLKKTITYEDFNGDTISEDFFFHLSKAELVELEMSHKDGLSEALQRIVAAEDNKSIVAEFKNIILTAYGQKSPDGKRFVKNQELRDEFQSTEAYSVLFMELVTETDKAVEFVNGVIPKGMDTDLAKMTETEKKPAIAAVPEETPEPQIVTRKDIVEMPPEELATLGDRIQAGEVKIAE